MGTGFAWDVTGRGIFKLNCHRRLEDYIAKETIVFKLTLIWFPNLVRKSRENKTRNATRTRKQK